MRVYGVIKCLYVLVALLRRRGRAAEAQASDRTGGCRGPRGRAGAGGREYRERRHRRHPFRGQRGADRAGGRLLGEGGRRRRAPEALVRRRVRAAEAGKCQVGEHRGGRFLVRGQSGRAGVGGGRPGAGRGRGLLEERGALLEQPVDAERGLGNILVDAL